MATLNEVFINTRKAMGGKKTTIIDYMKKHKIKGFPGGISDCPLAIAYQKAFKKAFRSKGVSVIVTGSDIEIAVGDELLSKLTISAEKSFINAFDTEKLPELMVRDNVKS